MSAGKVKVVALAVPMFWMPLVLPERTRAGTLPAPDASETAALAEVTTSPLTCTLPPLTTFCIVMLPARLTPPIALAGPAPLKSSVEPAGATMLVLGKFTTPPANTSSGTNW